MHQFDYFYEIYNFLFTLKESVFLYCYKNMSCLVIVACKSSMTKHERFYPRWGFILIIRSIAAAGTAIAPP